MPHLSAAAVCPSRTNDVRPAESGGRTALGLESYALTAETAPCTHLCRASLRNEGLCGRQLEGLQLMRTSLGSGTGNFMQT